MEEIELRGQRIDNGEFVYWDRFGEYSKPFVSKQDMHSHVAIQDISPETAARFTGIKDIHKKKVFEGDYVKVLRDDSFKPYVAQVYFASGCFGTTWYDPIGKKNMFVHLYKFRVEITEED